MIVARISGHRWPARPVRFMLAATMAGLSAHHLTRQGLYTWAVVSTTIVGTTIVLRALCPHGPVWHALFEEDSGCPTSNGMSTTGYGPVEPWRPSSRPALDGSTPPLS